MIERDEDRDAIEIARIKPIGRQRGQMHLLLSPSDNGHKKLQAAEFPGEKRSFFKRGIIISSLMGNGRSKSIATRINEILSEKRVRVGDIEIAYIEYGSGEPLLLITAYGITKEMWDGRFIKQLASQYRVIVFDNRGLGHTSAGRAAWSIDQFAADTSGLIDALGLEKANVLGWSMGGDVALCLTVNFPRQVNRLICYAADCGGPNKIDPPRYRDVLKEVYSHGYVPFQGLLARLFPPEWMQEHPDYWKAIPFPHNVHPWHVWRQNKAYEEWPGVYEKLAQIKSPTLIVTGTRDVSTPPENAGILSDRIPFSETVLFKGAGHGLVYQHPYELAALIKDFVQEPTEHFASDEIGSLLAG